MTVPEEIYVLIGVGGFLLVLEGCISYIGKFITKDTPPEKLKFGSGLVTFAIGCIFLFWGPK
jgi:uncharacterized membrane protein HdeD (DUF308 family)